jgi:hypothetical protein
MDLTNALKSSAVGMPQLMQLVQNSTAADCSQALLYCCEKGMRYPIFAELFTEKQDYCRS